MSVNKVILVGFTGKNPEIRYFDGVAMASFSLATTERQRTSPTGVVIPERTEWHNIVMWAKDAEIAEKYISKGTKLYIEGRLRTRVWQDKAAIKHTVTEIIVENFDILQRPNVAAPQNPQSQPPQPPQPPREIGSF